MTMARFACTEEHTADGRTMPAYIAFIREVNGVRPGTFGTPEHQPDKPYPGYVTEKYPEARVIHGIGDDGVRVVADSDVVREAFRRAASVLGIHLAGGAEGGN